MQHEVQVAAQAEDQAQGLHGSKGILTLLGLGAIPLVITFLIIFISTR